MQGKVMHQADSQQARAAGHGLAPDGVLATTSGLEFMRAIRDGRLPAPMMARTLGFRLVEVEVGHVTYEGIPAFDFYNPLGSVHGGWSATLLDSCMSCAVHTTLPAGTAYTTVEFKTQLLREINAATGPVRAVGQVVKVGRRIGTANGELLDRDGRLLASGSVTCLVFPTPDAGTSPRAAGLA
jgi:uncharacterized protein (TIGR00369 family)